MQLLSPQTTLKFKQPAWSSFLVNYNNIVINNRALAKPTQCQAVSATAPQISMMRPEATAVMKSEPHVLSSPMLYYHD
jgi:hypothetical protein